jgi:3-hydroxyisobutyrate dehydrogenase-like beta-hydroxyacid dehydrogenase
LGDIGSGVARALAAAGLEVMVFDLRREAVESLSGIAKPAATTAELGERCDVVVVAVVSDQQVLDVLRPPDGVLSRPRPGSVVVLLSTIGTATLERVAEMVAGGGARVLDCGVSGGPGAAAEGSLVSMVGGDQADIESVRPVLEAFSSAVVHMGPLGAGLKAKLARNVIQYGSWLAAYEAQRIAEAAGIELPKLAKVVRESDKLIGGSSRLMFRQTAAPFGPDDDAGIIALMSAGCALAHKDLRAAIDLAGTLGIDVPLVAMAESRMDAVFGLSP